MHEQNNHDGPKCSACNQYTMRLDSCSTCTDENCERFGVSVNDKGQTDEEAHADAIAPLVPDADATGCSEAAFEKYLNAGPSHNQYGYARND